MVWEVVTPGVPSSTDPNRRDLTHPDSEHSAGVMMDTDADDVLRCDEHLASSPGRPTSDSHMEYAMQGMLDIKGNTKSCSTDWTQDDLPELQEVQEEEEQQPALYQLAVGVSHHTLPSPSPSSAPEDTRWLTQLAHIATGPQSPLLAGSPNSRSSPIHILGTSSNLHSYARPPPTTLSSSAPLPSRGYGRGRRRCRTTSECGSAVSTRSSLSDDEDMGWSHSWPATAWHCFLKGTRLRFHRGPNVEWQEAEALDSDDEDSDVGEDMADYRKGYGSEGLGLVEHTEIVLSGQSLLQLTFDPGAFGHSQLTVQCQLDHPFFVKNKGWSSFYPSLTVVHYGIPCYEVEVGDVCLPPGHRDAVATDDSLVFDTFRSYDFTPLDSSAVYVLSSMARQRRTSQSSGGAVSPDRDPHQDRHSPGPSSSSHRKPPKSQNVTPAGSSNATPTKCKRPMNAFMLFAKKYRVEYTQMYPGKDNRAISVLLGERWKKMRGEERRLYTMEAKALADEQKRINPDCWKRKRTNSGSQGN